MLMMGPLFWVYEELFMKNGYKMLLNAFFFPMGGNAYRIFLLQFKIRELC